MDTDLFAALLDKGIPFAMMLAAIFYFRDLNNKKDTTILNLNKEKDELHKELRVTLENSLNKSNDAISNNTVVLSALKDVFLKNV